VPQRVRIALERGDSAGLLVAIAEALRAGSSARDLAEVGLRFLLKDSGWELRGARWSHAFLALEAAHQLALSMPTDIAEPAVAGALAFLDGSSPTRGRPLDPQVEGQDRDLFETAILRSDLTVADSALVDLMDQPDLERRWFSIALTNFEGWGHRSLIAMATWRLAAHLDLPKGWLLRAGLRNWIPWDGEPELVVARRDEGPGVAVRLPSDSGTLAEAVGTSILTGNGAQAVADALAQGTPAAPVVDGILRAACRSCSALPELRQIHSVTLSRAVAEAVLFHGSDPDLALPRLAAFVGEGWQLALKSGRIVPGQDAPELGSPGSPPEDGLAAGLCRREATPNFGHLIKLVEVTSSLPGLMAPEEGERWAGAVLRAAEGKATRYRRVWATVVRHRAENPF
jgi:hypothetical protein